MPTVHEVAARAKRAMREGRSLQLTHFATGTILAVWTGKLPGKNDKPEPIEIVPLEAIARVLSLSFFDPRTRKPMMLDPARALSWLELIFGDDRHKAFAANEVQANNGRREVWNFYVCYRNGEAYMPAYTKAMGDAGIVPYMTLERQFLAAREAIREARKT